MSFAICSVTILVELPESTITQNLLCPYYMCSLDGVVESSGVSIMFTVYSSAESSYVDWVSGMCVIICMPYDGWSRLWLSISFTDLLGCCLFRFDLHTFAKWFCLLHRRNVWPIAWHFVRWFASHGCPQFLQLCVGALLLLLFDTLPIPLVIPLVMPLYWQGSIGAAVAWAGNFHDLFFSSNEGVCRCVRWLSCLNG